MVAVPTKRVAATEGQAQACPTADATQGAMGAETRSAADLQELRAFFLLLDKWDRELTRQ